MREDFSIICIAPVRNEASMLPRFIECASQWADRIVIADQRSADGSGELAARYPNVTVVSNDSNFDEHTRQTLLIEEARKTPGRRLLIALDVDEVLTANWKKSPEWRQMLVAPPGTTFRFEWVNVLPGAERCWMPGEHPAFGFMDDGRAHRGGAIHGARVPVAEGDSTVSLRDIKVLHFQYANWRRMKSKQRWYQCWELLNTGERPIRLYRRYHHMDKIPAEQIHPLAADWVMNYERAGIEIRNEPDAQWFFWDEEILKWFKKHGLRRFRKLDIWDVDWACIAERVGAADLMLAHDPRRPWERLVHRWLARTQVRRHERSVRWVQRLLIPFGW